MLKETPNKGIDCFPNNTKFKYDWRKYQKRVLDELTEHLDDNHLHIIAPPGSGKTILGLEVAIRLNKPTLILAPTIAIRNQWIQRLCELFLQTDQTPDWISRDIKNPKFLTVSTYQGLHAACTGTNNVEEDEEEEEETEVTNEKGTSNSKTQTIINGLLAKNVGTIVVDEAHHLKNAWWQSLTKIKKAIKPTIVGLTATPPYDVTYAEWQRYISLNGPVDTEISVPELIVEGNLCPHQDYVYFSRPSLKESKKIDQYRSRIETLFTDIKADEILINAFENHPIFKNPNENLNWIYTNLEYYSATLIFLNAVGKKITNHHIEIIGDQNFIIPKFTYEWVEILLTFYLYHDAENFKEFETHQEKLTNKLKRAGAMERRSINFQHNRKINKFLSSSTSKLDSVNAIVDFEYKQLKQDLRMVILSDYIRKEFIVNEEVNNLELNKMGVLPIFEKLRRTNDHSMKIGVLTGSLIIIPVSALPFLKLTASKYGVDRIPTTILPYDKDYAIINTNQKLKHDIVSIITQIFQEGHIEVLVGTKSLLGEGWDAPSINALILASFVGSYVLSNQMRGRAIRTEQGNIGKTSNIWHLVCIDPTDAEGGDDIQLLKRRFKSFVGVSFHDEVSIENGIERLDLPANPTLEQELLEANTKMFNHAQMREELKQNWLDALRNGTILIEELRIPFPKEVDYQEVKSLYYNRTLKYLLGMLGSGITAFGFDVLQGFGRAARHIKTKEDFVYWLMIVGGVGVVIFGKLAFKTFRAYVKYRDISKDIHQIGDALLHSLIKVGNIHTDYSELEVVTEINSFGVIYCHLKGGTTFEKSTFIKSLQEIIGPVENPRYIIIRKSFFLKVLAQKDYHSLPESLGRKKQFAEYFETQWRNIVGSCELVYTRTIQGRKLLLKSRIQSLASEFEDKSDRVNKWR